MKFILINIVWMILFSVGSYLVLIKGEVTLGQTLLSVGLAIIVAQALLATFTPVIVLKNIGLQKVYAIKYKWMMPETAEIINPLLKQQQISYLLQILPAFLMALILFITASVLIHYLPFEWITPIYLCGLVTWMYGTVMQYKLSNHSRKFKWHIELKKDDV